MYIANYEDGWELLSTDHRVPLVMASSDTGQFNISDTTSMNPALLAYLNSLEKRAIFHKTNRKHTRKHIQPMASHHFKQQRDKPGFNPNQPKGFGNAPESRSTKPGSGYWELISTSAPKNKYHKHWSHNKKQIGDKIRLGTNMFLTNMALPEATVPRDVQP